jgi:hypothetical protein
MILENPRTIEQDLFPLDAHLCAGNGGLIDLLAVDRSGTLAVLGIDRTGEDDLLRRSLEHQGWVGSQIHFLRRLYGPERIHPFRSPRAILLSTRFSAPFLNKVAELPVPIMTRLYRLAFSGNVPRLHLEPAAPVAAPQPPTSPRFALPQEVSTPAGPADAGPERLTSEELEAFYRFERRRLGQEEEGAVER